MSEKGTPKWARKIVNQVNGVVDAKRKKGRVVGAIMMIKDDVTTDEGREINNTLSIHQCNAYDIKKLMQQMAMILIKDGHSPSELFAEMITTSAMEIAEEKG